MNVTFSTFSKRRNSTKRPSGGSSYSCLLKDATSTARPSIALKWSGSGSPTAYNYCYITDFGRYYYINSWTYTDRQWIADCVVDVLATYKTEIGAESKYVLRSASEEDAEVIDTLYTPKTKAIVSSATAVGTGFNWAKTLAGGTIIVGLIGVSGSAYAAGGVSYYATTPAGYMQFLSDMYTESLNNVDGESYGSTFGDAIKALSRNLLRSVTNPTQYIKSAMWFPFTFSTSGGVTITIGGITSSATFYPVTDPIKSETVSFSISTTPNGTGARWRNLAPYVQFTAYLPPYGTFNLDTRKLYGANSVRCIIESDCVSGLSHMILTCARSGYTDNPTFAETVTQVGVPMDFSGVKGSQTSISSIISTVGSFAAGDAIGAAAGIVNTLDSSAPASDSRSSYGGISGDVASKYIERVYYEVPEEDPADQGTPLMKIKTLSSLSGYILCADGHVDCAATDAEHAQIEAFLTGGFFYE